MKFNIRMVVGVLLVMLLGAAVVSAQEGGDVPPIVTPGTEIILQGQVTDTAGQPLADAIVSIWQADAEGRLYDAADADSAFQYAGTATTDAEGYYAFLTLMPAAIDPDPAMIMVRVAADGLDTLTTAFYLDAEAENEMGLPVVMPTEMSDAEGQTVIVFEQDIVVAIGDGTLEPTVALTEIMNEPSVDFAALDNNLTSTADADETITPIMMAMEALSGRALYRIVPEQSQVSFQLEEDLRGVRTTVIGITSQVAGDLIIDFDDPFFSQLGTIRINARTLATDNESRNRALRAQILLSSQDEYEFIDFVPTFLNDMPAFVAVGETYTFSVTGNLTIIGVTQEVTFEAEGMLVTPDQVSGTATATIRYADWGIRIPNVPGVSNVTEEAILTINFIANQVEQ